MDRVLNAQIRELCGVMKGVDKRINKGVLQWFGHVERVENDTIGKRVYVGVCDGIHSMGRLWKRWIDNVKDWRKRGLDVRQTRRMLQDRSEWQRFVSGNAWGIVHGMKP